MANGMVVQYLVSEAKAKLTISLSAFTPLPPPDESDEHQTDNE
jgi:hypothetical protein